MSEIKVNKISPKQTCTQLTLGDSGDTIIIPAGATITNNGTATGFGRTGTVNWDTTPKTTTVTTVSGVGYFVDTTSGAITVNLPAGTAGSIVAISDYANTAATNNINITPNGTDKIDGVNGSYALATNGASITFIYIDSTRGWKDVNDATLNAVGIFPFVVATGGTITTSGDYKIHTFTGPGTFQVTNAGAPLGSNSVDYLVVAGGGGGGRDDFGSPGDDRQSGGGGAGGFRISNFYGLPAPTTSPLASPTGIPVTVTSYPITIGAGGSGGTGPCGGDGSNQTGSKGNNTIFSTITSTGGGGGLGHSPGPPSGGPNESLVAKTNGGSGGGVGFGYSNPVGAVGTGNNPPVSPSQGNNGGLIDGNFGGAGGGGAAAVGSNGPAGPGGIGSFASPSFAVACAGTTGPVPGVRYFAGGGAGSSGPGASGTGGAGGGGSNADGTVNTGGGGGGRYKTNANSGGSGIVVIRYKFQ
jgi:hypothetical protein